MSDNIVSNDYKDVPVVVQSQTEALFQYLLMNDQKTDILLTSDVSVDDESINVSSGHGFTAVAGEYIVLRSGDVFEQLMVISVVVDEIFIEMPIAQDFLISNTSVIRGNVNMNIDGVATPTDFKFSLLNTGGVTPIDVSSVVITMQHGNNVPDDGLFGGLPKLPKGMYIRKVNGIVTNLGNYKSNQEFRNVGADIAYSDKAPSGANATNIIIEIEKVFGKVIRIDPRDGDIIVSRIRDVITVTAGMTLLTTAILGSFTSGE